MSTSNNHLTVNHAHRMSRPGAIFLFAIASTLVSPTMGCDDDEGTGPLDAGVDGRVADGPLGGQGGDAPTAGASGSEVGVDGPDATAPSTDGAPPPEDGAMDAVSDGSDIGFDGPSPDANTVDGAQGCSATSPCPSGQVCARFGSPNSPTACQPDPCAGATLSCDCAYAVLCAPRAFGLCDVQGGVVACFNAGPNP